jgi:long-subunit acyl-CoA synthetase (AMP-forming)
MNEKTKKIKEMASLSYLAEREHEISMSDAVSEEIQDAAYEEYWKYVRKMAEALVSLINVDEKTATRMAVHKRTEIMALLKRLAA